MKNCSFLSLLKFKFLNIMSNLVPNMGQMIFSYILVQGSVGSSKFPILSPYYDEVCRCSLLGNDHLVAMNGEWCFQMLYKSFFKCYRRFTNIFMITVYTVTSKLVDTHSLVRWYLYACGLPKVLESSTSLK